MGARGPLAQPDNVRQLRGNPGKRRPPKTPSPVKAAPGMPTWLDKEGRAEWKRVVPELERLGLLTRLDRAVLAMYCDTWSKWCQARKALKSLIVAGAKGDRKHPAWQIYRDAEMSVSALAKELGLSPNARGRMKAPDGPDDPEDDLD